MFIFGRNTSKETDSLYIFDEIPPEDVFKFEAPVQESLDVFGVQIGAFSNLEKSKRICGTGQVNIK